VREKVNCDRRIREEVKPHDPGENQPLRSRLAQKSEHGKHFKANERPLPDAK
jgi:hypothetical protein